jgi:hypothetical protein
MGISNLRFILEIWKMLSEKLSKKTIFRFRVKKHKKTPFQELLLFRFRHKFFGFFDHIFASAENRHTLV